MRGRGSLGDRGRQVAAPPGGDALGVERARELLAGLADEVDGADGTVRGHRLRQREEALALERAAEDQVQRIGIGGQPAQRCGHVGRLRVVDEPHAARLAHELEPVRHPWERAERLGDRCVVEPERAGDRGRRGGVLAIVLARDLRLGGELVADENSTRRRLARDGPEAARHDGDVAGALVLEDAQLGLEVGLEAAVAVEVVGLEVEEDGRARVKLVHVLELEGRDLADDARSGGDRPVELAERAADVASHRRAEHQPEQLARRRLAVRPGDRDELGPGEQAVAELELAPHGHPELARARYERRLTRYSRALDHKLECLHQLLVLGAQVNFDTRLGKPARVEVGAAIDPADADAPSSQRQSRRLARAGEADDERRGGQSHGRNER